MSQIKITLLFVIMALALAGCGDKNSQANFESLSGKHVSSWLPAGHTVAAKSNLEACTECHGSDFSGGISKVACTQCHLGNVLSPHPVFWNYTSTQPTAWGTYAYVFHGKFAKEKGSNGCAVASCHGTGLQGVADSGPSCTSCHKDSMSFHPVEWTVALVHSPGGVATIYPDHGKWFNNVESNSCKNAVCHGPQGDGVFLSGLKCTGCHKSGF
jgi:hypothetical protein